MKRPSPARISLALVTLTSLGCVLVSKEGGELLDDSTSTSPDDTTPFNEADGDEHAVEESGPAPDCIDDADCGDPGLECIDGACVTKAHPLACNPATPPSCGNGIVEAMEECDGNGECEPDCSAWWDGGGIYQSWGYIDANPRPGGDHDMLALDPNTGSYLVGPIHNGGDFTSSTVLDAWLDQASALSTDPAGNVYVAGRRDDGSGIVATVVALDAAGNLRWTADGPVTDATVDIAADGNVVAIGGGVVEDEASGAWLWILDPDGNEVATVAGPVIDARQVSDVVIVDGAIFGLSQLWGDETYVTRWTNTGDEVWSLPGAGTDGPATVLQAMAPDGSGGVWAGGGTLGAPVLLHLDGNGNELERSGCIGGRPGSIVTMSRSPGGRLGLGMIVETDTGLDTPWFAVRTGDVIDFARQPGVSPGEAPSIEAGSPIFVTWWSDGSFVTTFQMMSQGASANWEIFFTP